MAVGARERFVRAMTVMMSGRTAAGCQPGRAASVRRLPFGWNFDDAVAESLDGDDFVGDDGGGVVK